MGDEVRDVIYLCACAVNGAVPAKERVDGMDLDAVYSLAARHMITAAVAFALESAGFRDERSGSAITSAVRKAVIFDEAWSLIRAKLGEAGIWYMPLKGAVLKDVYPEYGMREFADFDILFDESRTGDVRRIMEGLGYAAQQLDKGAHDVYRKAPFLVFEMHRALFEPLYEKQHAYYRDVTDRLIGGPGLERRFTPEDFYLYQTAHECKHYEHDGTGLRSLLDTYVYLTRVSPDMEYVASEAEKMGIGPFEKRNRELALRLFGGDGLAGADDGMMAYFLASGAYGTYEHRMQNRFRETGRGKLRYMLDRFLVPVSQEDPRYADYARVYPFFYRHRILLPVLPFYRILKGLRNGRLAAESRAITGYRRDRD